MIGVYILTGLILLAEHINASGWSYDNQEQWPKLCHEGTKQSPIALTRIISRTIEHPHLVLNGYGENLEVMIKNNGHSAEVRPIEGQVKPQMRGAGLPRIYELDHFHFHWPSEHVMEDIRFPLELHMVHYAADFKNVSNAIQHPNGVAVLGILFHMSKDDDEDFEPLLELIKTVQEHVNEATRMDNVMPKEFLPRDLAGYFRYDGSLTTPDCNEGVVWTVLTQTIPISKSQVAIFEKLHTDHNTVLTQNYRTLQPLNYRILFQRVNPPPGILISSGSSKPLTIAPLIFLALFINILKHLAGYINKEY